MRAYFFFLILTGIYAVPPEDYQLVWTDEFDHFDDSKWTIREANPSNPAGPCDTHRSKDNIFVQDGKMVIEIKQEGNICYDGLLYTESDDQNKINKAAFKYGYFESLVKIQQRARGFHSAFWLKPRYWWQSAYDIPYIDSVFNLSQSNEPEPGMEIDIMEYLKVENNTIYHTNHFGYGKTRPSSAQERVDYKTSIITDFSSFHKYAVHWTPEKCVFYVNDSIVGEIIPQAYMEPDFVVIGLSALWSEWAGWPSEVGPFPDSMIFDYVRVYQKPGTEDSMITQQPVILDFKKQKTMNPWIVKFMDNTLNINSENPLHVSLYDLKGKLIKQFQSKNLVRHQFKNSGIYYLRIKSENLNHLENKTLVVP